MGQFLRNLYLSKNDSAKTMQHQNEKAKVHRELNVTSGAQFATLPLVISVLKTTRTVVTVHPLLLLVIEQENTKFF